MAQSVSGNQGKGKLRLVGQPVSLSRTPSRLAVRPPEAGEHTDAVLKEFGFSGERDRRAAQGRRGVRKQEYRMTRPTRCSRARKAASAS